MNEVSVALYNKLTGGTALTALLAGTTSVYESLVPRGAALDAVVFSLQGGGDANWTPRRRKELRYMVKAVSDGSVKTAGAIDAQIDTLLHRGTLTVSGWTSISVMREADVSYAETTPEGRNYWHVGGVYRLRIGDT